MTTQATADFDTIRADHTGSLRRPEWLKDVYRTLPERADPEAELHEAQDRAVRMVIRKQEEIGLPFVTDGELRRVMTFQDSFGNAVSGFDAAELDTLAFLNAVAEQQKDVDRMYAGETAARIESGVQKTAGHGHAIQNRLPVRERLQLRKNVILDEYRRASALTSSPVKLTLIGPDRISQRFAYEESRAIYADMDAFLADVIAIEREMIAEVVAAGCRYIQIDEPGFTAYIDPPLLAQMEARGEDPIANLDRSIRANNAVIDGFDGVTFAVHVCRGGTGGRGGPGAHREGSYEAIAERLFGALNYKRFLLEYDSDAAGDLDPIRFLDKGKIAVLGLVSNNDPEVETADYLKRRLDQAAAVLPIEQIAICPRCGFLGVDEEVQWAKLQVIVDVAREVWGD